MTMLNTKKKTNAVAPKPFQFAVFSDDDFGLGDLHENKERANARERNGEKHG
jgi:hypothetical protein